MDRTTTQAGRLAEDRILFRQNCSRSNVSPRGKLIKRERVYFRKLYHRTRLLNSPRKFVEKYAVRLRTITQAIRLFR